MRGKRPAAGGNPGGSRRGRPPIEEITERQRCALAAIRSYLARRRFPPTIKELGEALGIAPSSAHELVKQLIRKSYLRRDPGKARSLEVIKMRGRR
ncbi:MAG: LexA family protein [Deltaproteobacteria bacterium]